MKKQPIYHGSKSLLLYTIILLSIFTPSTWAQKLERVLPESVGMSSSQLNNVDLIIEDAISAKQLPGAVLAVVKDGKMAYIKAYGNKSIYPQIEKMDEDVIFDLASLTKPIATATATMILLEQGKIRLIDNVDRYIPGFKPWSDGKRSKNIRIIDLLTHTSGLPAYAPVEKLQKEHGSPNPDAVIEYNATCEREYEPLTMMKYSCLNFITLQRIIETVSGQNINEFTQEHIFKPLHMAHTSYQPDKSLYPQIAPTEVQKDGSVLLGSVHDPLARVMNDGLSGNAGLFSTADDVAVFTAALLNGGEWNGARILSPLTVEKMRSVPKTVQHLGRSLGWDLHSAYASNLGDLLSDEAFGHTGYTGTSLVIDPVNNLGIIFLANSVHPYDDSSIVRLRSLVANGVAASLVGHNATEVTEQEKPSEPWSYEKHYIKRLEEFAQEPPISSNDIVMLGNSITEGGNWNTIFASEHIRNRGISGDNAVGVFNRLESILEGQPKKLFLLIGINDLASGVQKDTIIYNIEKIIQKSIQLSPSTKIYLQSILPVDESFNRYKGLNGKTNDIIYINKKLKKMARKYHIPSIDLHKHFTEKDKVTLRKELTYDGLHLNQEGYAVWGKLLTPYMKLH